jgi:N-acetylneuraminic acid mutarotase
MKKSFFFILFLIPFLADAQTGNTWEKKNDFTGSKRTRAASFVIGDFAYLCGGVDTSETVLKDLWQYDPLLDIWTQKADLVGPARRDAVAFSIQGKGYVGTGMDSVIATYGNVLSDFYAYDPVNNSWIQKANFPAYSGAGTYFATGFSIDSKGYICGGKRGPNQYSNELWEYKPSNDSWIQRSDFPGGVRYQLLSFIIGFDAFVGLGTNQDLYKKDLWRYSAGSNEWTACADLPGSERAGAAAFSIGLRGFVCTGTNGGMLDDLWEYNPFSNDWKIRASYGGSERKNSVAFTLNNKGFVGTGSGYSGKKASFHEYSPLQSIFLEVEKEKEIDFAIYPNPIKESFSISYRNNEVSRVHLVSNYGIKVLDERVLPNHKLSVDKSIILEGVYIANLINENGDILGSKKVIIL